MKKKLEVNSPEFRDLVGKLTNFSLPSLSSLPPLAKIPMSPSPIPSSVATAPIPKKDVNLPKIIMSSSHASSIIPSPKKDANLPQLSKIIPSPQKIQRDVTFTGIKDTDLLILMQLDDKSLLQTCKVNMYVNTLCKNEDFWKIRFRKRFGNVVKPEDKSWKKYYLYLLEEEKGINLYWGKEERPGIHHSGQGGFYLDDKSGKYNKEDLLLIPNVYKTLRNTRHAVLGMYEAKSKKLISPIFNSESALRQYRVKNYQFFKDRPDLRTFKIHRPFRIKDLYYPDEDKKVDFKLPTIK